MSVFVHLDSQVPCPFLPVPREVVMPETTKIFRGGERGEAFYEAALLYAQSLWLRGFPAKSLLLMTRGMGADLRGDEAVLRRWPLPYAGVAWVMRHRKADQFMGNPRRHYQHLATRMVEPRRELRAARAWACWHLASAILPPDAYPVDQKQIDEEGVRIPERAEVASILLCRGIDGEAAQWSKVLDGEFGRAKG
ncbi:hypothetical protein BH23VER1_BH23VER1_03520 [soil metagenome]